MNTEELIRVINLATEEEVFYSSSIGPRHAVICAYAQGLKDWNTWEYDKYNSLVLEGAHSFGIGDWATLK